MEIVVLRHEFQPKATISDLIFASNNNAKLCNILEDFDRGLKQTDPLDYILKTIVRGETAIPYGRYRLTVDMSNRFKCLMPHILNVPGFDGIRQHRGCSDIDTLGCQLLGTWHGGNNWIDHSEIAFLQYMDILFRAMDRKEEMWLTVAKKQ
jgi:hypothetical protein